MRPARTCSAGCRATRTRAFVPGVITMQHMARKTGDLTIRLDRRTRARIDRLAEKRLGRKRSTGTFLKMLALSAVEREDRASELRRMLRNLPSDVEAAEE